MRTSELEFAGSVERALNKKKSDDYKPRLKQYYHGELRKTLMKQLGCDNIYQVPQLKKVVVNIGHHGINLPGILFVLDHPPDETVNGALVLG